MAAGSGDVSRDVRDIGVSITAGKVPVREGEAIAAPCQLNGGCRTDAGRGSRDDGNTAVGHGVLSTHVVVLIISRHVISGA